MSFLQIDTSTRSSSALNPEAFELLVGSSSEAYLLFDPQSDVIIYQNLVCRSLFSFLGEEIVGQKFGNYFVFQAFENDYSGILVPLIAPEAACKTSFSEFGFEGRKVLILKILDPTQSIKRKISTIVEQFQTSINILTDRRGHIIWVNKGFEQMTGYSFREVIGKKPGSFLQGKDTDPNVVEYMHSRLEQGHGFQVEILNYSKKGEAYWLLLQVEPVHDEEGQLNYFFAYQTDITEKKRSEGQLSNRLDGVNAEMRMLWSQLLVLFQSTNDGLILVDRNFRIKLFNQEANELYQRFSLEQLRVGQDMAQYVFPDQRTSISDSKSDTQEGNFVEFQGSYTDLKGEQVVIESSYYPVNSGQGSDDGLIIHLKDRITFKKKEADLAQNLQYVQSLLESSTSYLIRTDLDGKYTYVNRLFCEVFGFSEAELIGMTFTETVHHEDISICMEAAIKCLTNPDKIVQVIIRKPNKHGEFLHTEWEFNCIKDSNGNPSAIQAMGRDITRRLNAEKELIKAQNLYQNLVDNLPIAVFKSDYNTLVPTFLSPVIEHITGYTPSEWIITHGAFRHIHPDDLDQVKTKVTDCIESEQTTLIEYRSLHKEGYFKWLRTIIKVIRNQEDDKPFVLGFTMDVNEEKLVHLQIDGYENKLRAFFESSPDASLLVNRRYRIEAINQRGISFFQWWSGTSPAFGEDLRDHLPEFEKEIYLQQIEQSLRGESLIDELNVRSADGIHHWYRISINPAYDSDQKIIGAALNIKDIAYRKQAELALRESEQRFRTLADIAPVGIWMSDEQDKPVYYNKAWLKNTGRELESIINTSWEKLLHPDDLDEFLPWVEEQFKKQEEFTMSYRCKVGHEFRWLFDHVVPRFNEMGQFMGFLGSSTDISLQVQSIEELKAKESELKQLLLEKDLLIKELHHRVKNNLQVILGVIFLRTQGIENPQVKGILTDISRRLRSIALLHEKLIQKNPLEKVSIKSYFQSIVDELTMMHSGKDGHAQIHLSIQEEQITMDMAVNLGLILHELLTNALKYGQVSGPKKPIEVTYESSDEKRKLTVRDHGLGFPDLNTEQLAGKLGFQLVEILVSHLKGKLTVANDNGAYIQIDY